MSLSNIQNWLVMVVFDMTSLTQAIHMTRHCFVIQDWHKLLTFCLH